MPFSILLVEQSPVMRRYLQRAIAMPGLPEAFCLEAENTQTAAGLLDGCHIDLIVLDTNTLAPGGENLLQRVRGNAKLQHIPCIVISADATAARVQAMLDLGAAAYLAKPVTPGPLRAEIARTLDTRHVRN
jgi:two-component system chemotaxis response regulator CheY